MTSMRISGLPQHITEFMSAIRGADVDEDGAELGGRILGDRPLRTVGRPDDAIALASPTAINARASRSTRRRRRHTSTGCPGRGRSAPRGRRSARSSRPGWPRWCPLSSAGVSPIACERWSWGIAVVIVDLSGAGALPSHPIRTHSQPFRSCRWATLALSASVRPPDGDPSLPENGCPPKNTVCALVAHRKTHNCAVLVRVSDGAGGLRMPLRVEGVSQSCR